jgi:hypothetical protein
MKTHLAYTVYRKICFKLTIILASFGLKKNSKQVNNSELSGFPPQTTSQACLRQPFYKGLLQIKTKSVRIAYNGWRALQTNSCPCARLIFVQGVSVRALKFRVRACICNYIKIYTKSLNFLQLILWVQVRLHSFNVECLRDLSFQCSFCFFNIDGISLGDWPGCNCL